MHVGGQCEAEDQGQRELTAHQCHTPSPAESDDVPHGEGREVLDEVPDLLTDGLLYGGGVLVEALMRMQEDMDRR